MQAHRFRRGSASAYSLLVPGGSYNGALYVLDEPSIGLHPSNVDGLLGVVDDLLADRNSVVLVDHDVRVLRHADHLVEIGPGSGANGGCVIQRRGLRRNS